MIEKTYLEELADREARHSWSERCQAYETHNAALRARIKELENLLQARDK